jgi:hypothetical protein
MKKRTLLILAAGMGSRYGGLKQTDSVGPGRDCPFAGAGINQLIRRREYSERLWL